MRKPSVICLHLGLRLSAVILVSLFVSNLAPAQPGQIQFNFGVPATAELTPPQVDIISGATAGRLEQARALAAAKNWVEAVDVYHELSADSSGRVVALDDNRYVDVRTYCNIQLASLPVEGLVVYRRRVDPLAERWYREGLAARNAQLLRRVVDEAFCSSWGDDALLALGELALERGDHDAARRSWEQVSPLLRDPSGQLLWLALRDIDFNANWPEVQRRWQTRPKPTNWLAYPDTKLDLADMRARLILAAARAGELERTELELEVFRRLHPDAVGRFGGQQGPYVAALERLMSTARQWPAEKRASAWTTFAGSPDRSLIAKPLGAVDVSAWPKPVALEVTKMPEPNVGIVVHNGVFGGRVMVNGPQLGERESDPQLSSFPVVANDIVVIADAQSIRAVDLKTGRPAITENGILFTNALVNDASQIPMESFGAVAHGVPRYTLTVCDGVVYGRIGTPATSRLANTTSPGDRIIGFDLRREGLLTLKISPEGAGWSFDGVPLCDGRRLYVAMRHSDVTPHAYVACFDCATSTQLWRTSVGAADTPAAGSGDEITHNLLTLFEDRIYFNTNLGLIAALDTESGRLCWLHRYSRTPGLQFTPGRPEPLHFKRDPSPCIVRDGMVITAPADSPSIFAVDADTGLPVWENKELTDALQLLGVVDQNLVLGGNRLRSIDVRTGKVHWVWPESEHAGIRGSGRGVVAGNEVFWPTRNEIYVLNAVTGERTRSPIRFGEISHDGANLAVAQGRLILAGPDKLTAFGPATAPREPENEVQISSSNN